MTDRKVKLQNEIEQLSPEELEKEIENNKRKVARSIIFIAAAAIAFIAICIAWFVSNNRVSGTSGTVSAKYSGIEIGSEGKAGVHDDLLQRIKNGINTSQGGSINWMLSENSNMKNYKDGDSFNETTGAEYRKSTPWSRARKESWIFLLNHMKQDIYHWTSLWIFLRFILRQISR